MRLWDVGLRSVYNYVHLSGEECNDDDDPFAGEELLALDRLICQVQDPTDEPDGITPEEYINDDNAPCF